MDNERHVVPMDEVLKATSDIRDDRSIEYHLGYFAPEYAKKLYARLALPSYVHGYSLAIEYMTKWFENGFDKDYLKSIYIDGKHVIDDYKNKFAKMIVKGENPRARIEPRVEYDYDREGLDFYQASPDLYLQRSPWQESFFKDYDRDIYLGMAMRGLRMDFNFKVRVNTRAQQQDIYNRMELYFRIGATQTDYISVDFHVPKAIVIDIANRAGFEVKNDEVIDIIDFMNYLNQHSDLPWLFKIRAINQQPEYFVRITNLCAHIANKDKLQLDDGERDGKLDFNFHVEMNSILDIPVPHYYSYYSAKDFTVNIPVRELTPETVPLYTIALFDIPKVDEHGWNIAATTQYATDKGDIEMDISSIFKGDNILSKAINHELTAGINPSKFINVKVYKEDDLAKEMDVDIDWLRRTVIFNEGPQPEEVLNIVIYYDRVYINELDVNLHNYNNQRINSLDPGNPIKKP